MRLSNPLLWLLSIGAAAANSIQTEQQQSNALRNVENTENNSFNHLTSIDNINLDTQEDYTQRYPITGTKKTNLRKRQNEKKTTQIVHSKDELDLLKSNEQTSKQRLSRNLEALDLYKQNGPEPINSHPPTESPTAHPTAYPTPSPTPYPSTPPSVEPSSPPSDTPSEAPTTQPSYAPSSGPTFSPTICSNFTQVGIMPDFIDSLAQLSLEESQEAVLEYTNITAINRGLAQCTQEACGLEINIENSLKAYTDVMGVFYKGNESDSALSHMLNILENPDNFTDTTICIDTVKGELHCIGDIQQCDNSSQYDKLLEVGFEPTELKEKTQKFLNNLFLGFAVVEGVIQLVAIAYAGANKQVGNGHDCPAQISEFFKNIGDSAANNPVSLMISAGTLTATLISKLGENDFSRNTDTYAPELALAVVNAVGVALVAAKTCGSEKYKTANNRIAPGEQFEKTPVSYDIPDVRIEMTKNKPRSTMKHGRDDSFAIPLSDLIEKQEGQETKKSGGCAIS